MIVEAVSFWGNSGHDLSMLEGSAWSLHPITWHEALNLTSSPGAGL